MTELNDKCAACGETTGRKTKAILRCSECNFWWHVECNEERECPECSCPVEVEELELYQDDGKNGGDGDDD